MLFQALALADFQVHAGLVGFVVLKPVVLARQDSVQEDTYQRTGCETGEGDVDIAHIEADRAGLGVVDADGQHQDEGGDDDIAALGEVRLGLHDVADTDGGNHAVQHQGDASDDGARHNLDDGRELRAEGHQDGEAGSQTDDARVINAGQGQHAGVLAVGGVGRCAEQGGHGGGETVTDEGAVQAGVTDKVDADGGGDGGDIADVLHHSGKCDRCDGDHGGDKQRLVQVSAGKQREHGTLIGKGKSDPGCFQYRSEVDVSGHGCHQVGADDAHQDGDDLNHALAPDVAGNDDDDGYQGDKPVGGAAVNR